LLSLLHNSSFLPIEDWLVNSLGTLGSNCRKTFTAELVRLLDGAGVPAALKVAWNDCFKAALG